MLVSIEYRNKDKQLVDVETVEMSAHCDKLYHDLIGLLSNIENMMYDFDFMENEDYKKIRHKIFDIAGAIKRMPDNIVEEEACGKKATFKNILGAFVVQVVC